jgi:chromosome segregation ATPase
MAKRTATAAESNTPLEQLEALHKIFLDRFNRNSVPMGEQLTSVLGLLQEMFGDINKQLEDDDKKLAELEALLKKAEEILKRFEGINLDELDPEKIKQRVLNALADWQAGIKAELDALRGEDQRQNDRLDILERDLAALTQKVESIDFANLDPEKIKQKVLDALANWRNEVGNALLTIQTELHALSDKVKALEQGLAALKEKVEGIDVDPEKIKQRVLDALADWQKQVIATLQRIETSLAALTARVSSLESWRPIVETRLDDHGKHLTKHDSEIAKLVADLKALGDEVDRIIAKGGADPEDIKNRVLAALEAWQKDIFDKITALTGRMTKGEGDIQQHEKWIQELQKQVAEILKNPGGGTVDPEDIKNRVLAALADWKKKVDDELATLKNRLTEDEKTIQTQGTAIADLVQKVEGILKKIPELETVRGELLLSLQFVKMQLEERLSKLEQELASQVKRLDARISAIETTGIDPDDVRKIIEEEFKEWKLEIEAKFVSKADFTALQNALNELIKRVDALKTDGLNAEQVKALIHAEIDAWRKTTDLSIANLVTRMGKVEGDLLAFDTRMGGAETAIQKLKNNLAGLQKLVEEKLKSGADAEEVKELVLAELAKFRDEVNDRFLVAEKKIILLKTSLEQLREELEKLAANTPSAEAIRTQVLLLIAKWQSDLERNFADLKGDVKKDLKDLRKELDELIKRVNELVLTGGTPADVEARIRKAIEAWEAKLVRELDDIRKRNEEDRIGILSLRDLLSTLQERVRILEVSDFGKAIKDLSDKLVKIAKDVNNARAETEDLAEDLKKLTKQGGLLDALQKQLYLLVQQSKNWVKKEDVQALIEEALEDIEACKKDLCEQIKVLETKQLEHEKAIEDLITADGNLRDDFENKTEELEERIGQVGVLMAEADDELEGKIKDAEKDAKEYARDRDQELEHKLDKRLDKAERRLDKTEDRLNEDDERDEEQRLRIEDLQRQIDEWQPDPSGDAADRLARRCLEGRGIVCGFDVWHTWKFTLYIGPGAGVTSDGHIAKWNELEHFTHYQALENTSEYPFFVRNKDKNDKIETWKVWRLLAEKEDETQEGVHPLSPQQRTKLATPFIHDKVVLALLNPESHPDPDKVSFVLMSRHDAMAALSRKDKLQRRIAQHPDTDFLFEEDFSPLDEIPYEDDIFHALRPELGLREIPLPRFGLHLPDGCGADELDRTDFPNPLTLEQLFSRYSVITGEVFEKVEREMRRVVKLYHRLLFPQFGEDYFSNALDRLDEKWTEYKKFCEKHAKKPNDPLDARHFIQYFYDWARDLINAYHELRSELLQLMAACCINDANEHPRHLLLGLAMREEHNGLASPLRHEFAQPPIYNGNAARLETSRLYLRRWLLLVKGFLLPIHDDPKTNPVCCCDEGEDYPTLPDYEQLKITPGRSYFHPLSRQSVPFYYLVTLGTQSVHRFWDYRRSKTLTENQHLCYHANDTEESYSHLQHVIRPLRFTLDPYDFYRVEGHIGKAGKTGEIKDAILKIVRKYNLDFDVLEMEAKDTIESYPSAGVAKKVKFNTFVAKIQGAEHLAGVPKGGTFILVTEGGKVIGDFSVPYRCCENPLSIADCKPIIEKMAKTAINESEPEIKKAINEIAANRLKRDEAVKEVLESYNNQVSSEVDARLKELEEKELTNRKESEQIGIKIFDGLVELKGILATLDSITDCDQDKKKVEVLIDKLHANMDGSMKPCVELSSQLIKATLDLKRQPGRVG